MSKTKQYNGFNLIKDSCIEAFKNISGNRFKIWLPMICMMIMFIPVGLGSAGLAYIISKALSISNSQTLFVAIMIPFAIYLMLAMTIQIQETCLHITRKEECKAEDGLIKLLHFKQICAILAIRITIFLIAFGIGFAIAFSISFFTFESLDLLHKTHEMASLHNILAHSNSHIIYFKIFGILAGIPIFTMFMLYLPRIVDGYYNPIKALSFSAKSIIFLPPTILAYLGLVVFQIALSLIGLGLHHGATMGIIGIIIAGIIYLLWYLPFVVLFTTSVYNKILTTDFK